MAYTALYRKFRPDNYDDVKGQEHITVTLKNQLKLDRIGHAYLFCGTRGTGKTTVAKILAKAVNCEHPVDGNPCNECPTCKAIASNASMNVIELDAASNNGVDDIRQIVDEVQYRPTTGKYKVYIIDEVHALSTNAFNALLKTLEEPPEYVIFILATTEAHKIPITILSRCQRYDFKHISVEVIKDRMKELCDREGLEIEEKALRYIAKCADGSLRDALSLLDQCEAFSIGEKLTYEKTLEILGAVDTDVFSKMLRAVVHQDTVAVMKQLEDIVVFGRDLGQFVVDFTWYLRNMLLIKTSEGAEEIVDMSEEKMQTLKEEAQMVEVDTIMRYIRILSELSNQIKFSSQKRVLVEIALIKLMQPAMQVDYESLKNRVANIEKKLGDGILENDEKIKQLLGKLSQAGGADFLNAFSGNAAMGDDSGLINQGMSNQTQTYVKKLERAVPEDVQSVIDNWYRITSRIDGHFGVGVRKNKLSIDSEGRLCILYESSVDYALDDKPEKIELLEQCIEDAIQKHVEIRLQYIGGDANYQQNFMTLETSMINFEIEEDDNDDDEEEDF